MRILVVEDDIDLLEAIVSLLEDESYQVDQASAGDEGYLLAEQGIYDLLVLDIMLPGMDGLSIIRQLRKKGILTPALFLTAKDSVEDRVRGLDAGADDYIVKPFVISELLARIRALLRRGGKMGTEGQLEYGPISLRPHLHDGYVGEEPLKLTVKEYDLLEFLLRNREQIVTREQIFDRVWGFDSEATSTVVDVYVHHLRKKLAVYNCDHFVQTIRGVGYMLKEK
ncbi:response regulator transcription factor [Effusibacillus dendaii]|uniref:DNA-binding response regulator n=1 Tax=Effusibacillus dendaii TaxID=2743772 RepID=A0A7I8D4W3_9BACL|nr:response regulator transcription factor [Effusibacillus dendaii]BCJ85158.1 DNA-binding response regulator [Effusibacillus dendaii]